MSRGEKLLSFIKQKEMTVRDLSRATDVAYTTIRSMIERDLTNASIDNTIKICRVLGISVEDLLKEDKALIAENEVKYNKKHAYPYYNGSIAAGQLSSVEGVSYDSVGEIHIPDIIMGRHAGSNDVILMDVNGDSMNKVIPHESMIAVKQVSLSALQNNDIVVFSNDHQYGVKRFYDDRQNERLIFSSESTDRSFTDHIVPYSNTENLVIHGKVILYIVST